MDFFLLLSWLYQISPGILTEKTKHFQRHHLLKNQSVSGSPTFSEFITLVLGFNLVNHLNNGVKVNLSKTVCPNEKNAAFSLNSLDTRNGTFFSPDILCILSFQIFSSFGIILLFFPTALAHIFYFAIQHSLNT